MFGAIFKICKTPELGSFTFEFLIYGNNLINNKRTGVDRHIKYNLNDKLKGFLKVFLIKVILKLL